MTSKPPNIERRLVLARDRRRRYGVRVAFQVQMAFCIGEIIQVTLMLPNGKVATLSQIDSRRTGVNYQLTVDGFATAGEAEEAGMCAVQSLLLSAVSLDFGLSLDYAGHEPHIVYDRTRSMGLFRDGGASIHQGWIGKIVADNIIDGFSIHLHARNVLLAMELLTASSLESNDRTRFVMAVSAFEPLAKQDDLGPEVAKFIDKICSEFDSASQIPNPLRQSLRGRIERLKRESVRQALLRLCERWFPGNKTARKEIDYLYCLRSDILHEGRLSDRDIEMEAERRKAVKYLRQIIAQEYDISLKSPIVD